MTLDSKQSTDRASGKGEVETNTQGWASNPVAHKVHSISSFHKVLSSKHYLKELL